jgi:hypothetical protein
MGNPCFWLAETIKIFSKWIGVFSICLLLLNYIGETWQPLHTKMKRYWYDINNPHYKVIARSTCNQTIPFGLVLKYNSEKYTFCILVLNNSPRVTTPFTNREIIVQQKSLVWNRMKEFHKEINGNTFKQTEIKKNLDVGYFWSPGVFVSDNSEEFFKGLKETNTQNNNLFTFKSDLYAIFPFNSFVEPNCRWFFPPILPKMS